MGKVIEGFVTVISISDRLQKFISEYKEARYHQGGAFKRCSEQKRSSHPISSS